MNKMLVLILWLVSAVCCSVETQAKVLWKKGEQDAAREMCERSANFYTLNQAPMNYALARPKALQLLERLDG